MLKKLFYYNNGKVIEIEKTVIPKMKTGKNSYTPNDKHTITKKFIKQGIYHPEILNKTDNITKLYFDRKDFCSLLHNNKDLIELSKPGLFLNNIDNSIRKTNKILEKLSNYFLDSSDKEKHMSNLIELYRVKGNIIESDQLLQLLIDYRNFIFTIRITIYSEYLIIWNNLVTLKGSITSNTNILEDIKNYINIKKSFLDIDDTLDHKINFYDKRFKVSLTNLDNDEEKVINFITDFENNIENILKDF